MKIAVRSLVIALAVTGGIASSFAAPAATAAKTAKTSAMPVPTCAPGTGSCGLGKW